jgi:hypothetical protein
LPKMKQNPGMVYPDAWHQLPIESFPYTCIIR